MTSFNYKIYICSGNPTALIKCNSPLEYSDFEIRKAIEDKVKAESQNVEQVGFLDASKKHLEMAGGEFCGNATRAAIFELLTDGTYNDSKDFKKCAEIELTVSGASGKIRGGIDANGIVWCEMPAMLFSKELEPNLSLVKLPGITHVVIDIADIDGIDLKKQSLDIFEKYNLMNEPAAGAIYLVKDNMYPVVRVRDSNSLTCETACGSGIAAVAFAKKETQNLRQPYGEYLTAEYSNNSVVLKGPVFVLM